LAIRKAEQNRRTLAFSASQSWLGWHAAKTHPSSTAFCSSSTVETANKFRSFAKAAIANYSA
jgi:hypothetical protein